MAKKAVILAAGNGRRLDVFETIKPLIKVGGKPLIIHTIERLEEFGIKEIYIVVNKEENLIKREILHYPYLKVKLFFIEKGNFPKNMLGSIMAIKDKVKSPFFVTVCDLVFEENPFLFAGKQKFKNDNLGVFLSSNHKNNIYSGASGRIFYEDGKVKEAGSGLKKYNALETGIYYFGGRSYDDFFDLVKKKQIRSKNFNDVLSLFAKNNDISVISVGNLKWFDVNTPSVLVRTELFLRRKVNKRKNKKITPGSVFQKLQKTTVFNNNKRITYEVNVKKGLINNLEKYQIIPHEFYYSPHHLIVDKNIDCLYGDKIYKKLVRLGYKCNKILVDPGEWTKSAENFIKIAENILNHGIDKKSIIISVGGGVVKDLAGFLASSIYRGIGFISIPTTIMSQADAAIGLKQGVNGGGGKNLLGSFYAPMKIVVDPEVLLTLDDRYISDGLAECLKLAFSCDRKYYDFFNGYNGLLKDMNFLETVVKKSIELKVRTTRDDFLEEKGGLVNQYGHEIGHAVEYLSGYKLGHGESVAIGMRVSAEISELMGIAKENIVKKHEELIEKFGLMSNVPDYIKPDDIVDTLRYNKKFHGGEARLALVEKIGKLWKDKRKNVYTLPVGNDVLREAIIRSYEQ